MKPRRLLAVVVWALPLALLAPASPAQADAPDPTAMQIAPQWASYRGQVGLEFSTRFRVINGTSPYRWAVEPRPAGLSIDSSGKLAGIPTQAGSQELTITVTDATGASTSSKRRLNVAARQGSLSRVVWPTVPHATTVVSAVSSDSQWALLHHTVVGAALPHRYALYHIPSRTITTQLPALDSTTSADSGHFSWSLDNRYLLFWSQASINASTASPRVWRYDRVEQRYQSLTSYTPTAGTRGAWPVLSGNNRYLFFTSANSCGRPACTYRLDLTTQARRLVWGVGQGQVGYLRPGQVSADGAWVTSTVNGSAFTTGIAVRDNWLVAKNLTTGTRQTICRGQTVRWASTISGDGSLVAIGRMQRAQLWRTAHPGLLTISVIPGRKFYGPGVLEHTVRISSDGRSVEFVSQSNLFDSPHPPHAFHVYRYTVASQSWQVLDVTPTGQWSRHDSWELLNRPASSGPTMFLSDAPELLNTGHPATYLWTPR